MSMTLCGSCYINESQNALGPNRCRDDSECSGNRTCSPWNWCQGTSNCPCDIDESQNALGPNRCRNDSECSGDRTCSPWNWCQGSSNC